MISLKAMSVGDGYKYLTGHVARGDVDQLAHEGGATPLTRYYATSGYPPGRWMGSGLAGLGDDLPAGTPVEEWRMACLFAEGRDPATGKLLGRQPKAYASLAERIDAKTAELPETLTADERAAAIERIHHTENRRTSRTAKGGFDLTFTIPKSASALWAIADEPTQQIILQAHHDTLTDIIDYLEREAIFTRVGHAGVAQVDTRGIIAAGFDHWDSRGGDPNLHTHLAVANRVQTVEGSWLTIDSRGLHHAIVAVSELYDSMIADRLTRDLGVGWEPRERTTRRTVAHEISGISEELIMEFSARTTEIVAHFDRLVAQFVEDQGHQPTPTDLLRLRQQATLTQRPVKNEPAPLAVMAASWRDRAERVTGQDAAEIVQDILDRHTGNPLQADQITTRQVDAYAKLALHAVQARRSTWNRWNLITETVRLTNDLRFASPSDRETFTHRIVDAAQDQSINLHLDAERSTPERFHRVSGEDVFTQHAARRYTSTAIVGAEAYLLERATRHTVPAVPVNVASLDGLSDDQRSAVERIVGSGRDLEVLIGPAGTGKTTTLAALRDQWTAIHGPDSVIGLAPSASAAEVLAASLGVPCENTAKWLHETTGAGATDRHDAHDRVATALKRARSPHVRSRLTTAIEQLATNAKRWALHQDQLVIIDEASLAGTLSLAALAHQAEISGAKLLLVGDHAQLTAVDAGGALRMLAVSPNAVELSSVWRFQNDWERTASLALRDGDTAAIDSYADHGRVREGEHTDMLNTAYQHWLADTRSGATSLLIAADNTTVRDLNQRARTDLVAIGHVEADGVRLSDGSPAGTGDRIVTRRNNRSLRDQTGWVRNGDSFTVVKRHPGGALTVRREQPGTGPDDLVTLPDWYVAKHVGLGYATTAHRAQGATVDTSHTVVTTSLAREVLYVAMTRGRAANYAYVATDTPGEDPDDARHTDQPHTARGVLEAVLQRSGTERSATETALAARRAAQSMATLIPVYEHIAQQLSDTRQTAILGQLTTNDPATVPQIRESDAWPKLTALLRNVTLAGLDSDQILVDAWNTGFTTDIDPTAVLLGRVASAFRSAAANAQPVRYIAGLVVPAEPAPDPALQHALDQAATAITHRAEQLVHQAQHDAALWLVALGPSPDDSASQVTWATAAAAVATYRNRWDITDDEPLGIRVGTDRAQHRDRSRAQRAIDAHTDATPPTPDRVQPDSTRPSVATPSQPARSRS